MTPSTPCCAQPLDLGCHPACLPLTLDLLTAPVPGTYTLVFGMGPAGQAHTYALPLEAGDAIALPAHVLNDAYVYTFYVLDPIGQPLAAASGNACFRLRTTPWYTGQ